MRFGIINKENARGIADLGRPFEDPLDAFEMATE